MNPQDNQQAPPNDAAADAIIQVLTPVAETFYQTATLYGSEAHGAAAILIYVLLDALSVGTHNELTHAAVCWFNGQPADTPDQQYVKQSINEAAELVRNTIAQMGEAEERTRGRLTELAADPYDNGFDFEAFEAALNREAR